MSLPPSNPAPPTPSEPSRIAEAAFLGAFITSPRHRGRLAALVELDMFEDARHGFIYDASRQMHLEGKTINSVTLITALGSKGLLDAAGGQAYIGKILAETPDVEAAEQYGEAIRSACRTRRIVTACDELARVASLGAGSRTDLSEPFARLQAAYMMRGEVVSPKHIREFADAALKIQEARGLAPSVNIPSIDTKFNLFMPGELTVLAGRPSMGKTSLMRQIVAGGSRSGPVLVYSLEVQPHVLTGQIMCMEARVEYTNLLEGRLTQEDQDRLGVAQLEISERDIWIYPSTKVSALDVRLHTMQMTAGGRKPALVAIDYLGLMRHDRAERKDLEIANTTKSLKQISIECDVPILLLAQLNRDVEKRAGDNEYAKPRLSDLRDSGSIEQDADNVLFIWRREKGNEYAKSEERVLSIEKRRNGSPGTVDLMFHKAIGLFDEMNAMEAARYRAEGVE